VSTFIQDLELQIDALMAVEIARERIYLDEKSGAEGGPAGVAGGAGVRSAGRRDRGPHPGPVGPHGAGHVAPEP